MQSRKILAAMFVVSLAVPAVLTAEQKVKVLAAFGFVPTSTDVTYNQIGFYRYLFDSTSPSERRFHASLDLPEGAAIEGLGVEGCNFTESQPMSAALIEVDSATDEFTVYPDDLGVRIPGGAACTEVTEFFEGPTYFPRDNSYVIRVTLPGPTADHRFRAVRVYYSLQVAPASVPTFNDVPDTDPAFQFIEALVRSGITVGCGDGIYCPDNPVTRRQMAVFLAKGLGLGWPVN